MLILQLKSAIKTKEDAYQFLATVSSDALFDQHPKDATPEKILEYTIQAEILATIKIGSYSGINLGIIIFVI